MNRVVIETQSDEELEHLMGVLDELGYKPGPDVKVCGTGLCGQARLFMKG